MTKAELKGNAEYAAQVIEVKTLNTYEGLDNLRGVPLNGMTAFVPKDTPPGTTMLAIPAGAQLSEKFARANNLMRDQGGYIEDNRRVRAIRLRGVPSNILTVPAPDGVAVGTLLDTLDGETVCWKYEPPVKANTSRSATANAKAWKRVDTKFLPEHLDTSNWYRNEGMVPAESIFTITQKLHGTSIRLANTIVKRKLSWVERLAQRFGVRVSETEYDFVCGSRRVVKDPNNPNQNHFYAEDIYTREGMKYRDAVPRGFVVYGELIGWVGQNSPIQANYTYALPDGQCELYVYRVAAVTPDGILSELTWPAVRRFCADHGLKHVPEMFTTTNKTDIEEVSNEIRDSLGLKFQDEDLYLWHDTPVRLSANSPCDEGVVIRVDTDRSLLPEFYKAKSQQFLEHESKLLDKDVEILS
jgi:hypothetical protein